MQGPWHTGPLWHIWYNIFMTVPGTKIIMGSDQILVDGNNAKLGAASNTFENLVYSGGFFVGSPETPIAGLDIDGNLSSIIGIGAVDGTPLYLTGNDIMLNFADSGMHQATVGTAGSASALPANPSGYLKIQVEGTNYVVPYYKAS